MIRAVAFAFLLTAACPFAAQAQTCAPSQTADWMVNILLNRASALYNPGAAAVRPGDCQRVGQSPPDFSWPHLSGTAQYQVTLTYPDGHTKTLSAPQNWINWNEVLPAGNYSWQVQAGSVSSNVRQFTVGANAVPFRVPATLATMASQRGTALGALEGQVNGNLNETLPNAGAQGDGNLYGEKALKSLMAYVYDGTDSYKQDAKRRVLDLASWDPRGPTAVDDQESRFV